MDVREREENNTPRMGVALVIVVLAIAFYADNTPSSETLRCGGLPTDSVCRKAAAFSEAEIADILEVEQSVWKDGGRFPHLVNQSRVFGEKTSNSIGHSATYLHSHITNTPAGRAIMSKLKKITMELEAEAGWGIGKSGLFPTLNPRAVESIRYNGTLEMADTGAAEIGWHSDFMSVMTVSIMLSPLGAFSGGAFQTRRLGPDSYQEHQTATGDVLGWKSWDRHRVAPLVGHRHVLVVQWWIAPPHTSLKHGPASSEFFSDGPELLLPYCDAISNTIDPGSFFAPEICGKKIRELGEDTNDRGAAKELYQLALRYHERASIAAEGSVLVRQSLLGQARCLSRINFAPGSRPTDESVTRVAKLCERIHKEGIALERGILPNVDRDMAIGEEPAGQQKDLGNTVIRILGQVLQVEALGLRSRSSLQREYSFLQEYWG